MTSKLEQLEESIVIAHKLLGELAHSNLKMTEHLLAERGYVNDVLWAGTALPSPTSLIWQKSFAGPFASVAWADPFNLGLTLSTGQGNETNGPGVIVSPPGDAGCAPLSDSQLSVQVGSLSGKENTPAAPTYLVVNANAAAQLVFTGAGTILGVYVQAVGTAETMTLLDNATQIANPVVTALGWVPVNVPFNTSLKYTYGGTAAGTVNIVYQPASVIAESAVQGAFIVAVYAVPKPFSWSKG